MVIDYAQLIKMYGSPTGDKGHDKKYSPAECTGIRKRSVEAKPSFSDVSIISVKGIDENIMVSMRNTAGRQVLTPREKAHLGWSAESLLILV